jgi:hypothetical protein
MNTFCSYTAYCLSAIKIYILGPSYFGHADSYFTMHRIGCGMNIVKNEFNDSMLTFYFKSF